MMAKVHTVSIVPKNKYPGKAGGRSPVARGRTKVREPFTYATRDVIRPPVRSQREQPTRHNRGDGYFDQDR